MTKRGMMPYDMTKNITPPNLMMMVNCGCQTDSALKNALACNMIFCLRIYVQNVQVYHA